MQNLSEFRILEVCCSMGMSSQTRSPNVGPWLDLRVCERSMEGRVIRIWWTRLLRSFKITKFKPLNIFFSCSLDYNSNLLIFYILIFCICAICISLKLFTYLCVEVFCPILLTFKIWILFRNLFSFHIIHGIYDHIFSPDYSSPLPHKLQVFLPFFFP